MRGNQQHVPPQMGHLISLSRRWLWPPMPRLAYIQAEGHNLGLERTSLACKLAGGNWEFMPRISACDLLVSNHCIPDGPHLEAILRAHPLEINPDINLTGGDAVHSHACTLEHGDASPDDTQPCMRGHGIGGPPTATIRSCHAAHDNYAAV